MHINVLCVSNGISYQMIWMLLCTSSSFNNLLPFNASAAANWLVRHSSIIRDFLSGFSLQNGTKLVESCFHLLHFGSPITVNSAAVAAGSVVFVHD